MTDTADAGADPGKVIAMALRVWGYKQGEVVSLMIHLGGLLGIYRALDRAGPVTAPELAARTGLDARWLLEWLRCQAAAGLLDSADGEVFELTREGAALLADEEGSVWFAAGAFQGSVADPRTVDRLAESFRTGAGLSFDDFGPDTARKVERTLGPWSRLPLLPAVVPRLEGVATRLRAGTRVADVGCGSGMILLTLQRRSLARGSTATTRPGTRSGAPARTCENAACPTPPSTSGPPSSCLPSRPSGWC